jgi:hypothetical protein
MQVNASPSLASDTVADFNLKFAMVDAALTLADVGGNYAGGKPPVSLNGFDLIWENTSPVHVRFSPASPSLSFCPALSLHPLSCMNRMHDLHTGFGVLGPVP